MAFLANICDGEELFIIGTVRVVAAHAGKLFTRLIRVRHFDFVSRSVRIRDFFSPGDARIFDPLNGMNLFAGDVGDMSPVRFPLVATEAKFFGGLGKE